MRFFYHILKLVAAIFLLGVLPVSCEHKSDITDSLAGTISVNTLAMPGARTSDSPYISDNTFMVLFWEEYAHLESPSNNSRWPSPYLAAHAPQPVPFYERAVFDTRHPYPDGTTRLYATGYAPGEVLSASNRYRRLTATVNDLEKGRYDFLGCDVWSDVYTGNQDDPFAQDKNKLYFRHLAAKLVFYADRDRNTMENKQYVRNVRVTKLYMSIDGGQSYTPMYTPSEFEWKELTAADFTSTYTAAIEEIKKTYGVTTVPKAGYKAVSVMAFAGGDAGFVLEKHATDPVPVYGMSIDSCYVSNPIINGVVQSSDQHRIRLKMDISAELSFDPDFQMSDGNGSTTDDLTYTHTWEGVPLDAIYQVDAEGNKTGATVHEFKPGMEYRIYIHFYRKGVNLVAIEQPWNLGGVHYITISGADKQNKTPKNK